MSEFSVQLKKMRTKMGISQKQLGEMIGVSDSTVWSWEKGRSKPREPETIQRLIQVANGIH